MAVYGVNEGLDREVGMLQGQEEVAGTMVIKAEVPLAEMFGYSTTLRSLTQGRATWEAAVADPDSLAAHPQVRARSRQGMWAGSLWCEDVLGAAYEAYEAVTGRELTVEVAAETPSDAASDDEEFSMGEDFDFDDAQEMRRRYPKLWAICGWDEASSPTP